MRTIRLAGMGALLLSALVHAGDAEWTTSGPLGGHAQEIVFDPTTPNKAYATTPGGVFRSIDGGMTWTAADSGIVADTVYALPLMLDAEQPTRLYTFDSWGRIYRSDDSGTTWAILPGSPTGVGAAERMGSGVVVSDIHPTAMVDVPGAGQPCALLLGTATSGSGNGAMLYRSNTCGLSYTHIGDGLPDDIAVTSMLFDPANPSRVLVGLVTGGVGNQPLYVSNDSGLTFTAMTLSAIGSVDRLSFGIDGDIWVVVGSYDVFHSNDAGASWNPVGIAGISVTADATVADRAWIASSEGVYRIDVNGSLYTPTAVFDGLTPNPSYTAAGESVPAGARHLVWRGGATPTLFASTTGSGLYTLDASGTHWTPVVAAPAAAVIHALAIHPAIVNAGMSQKLWAGQTTFSTVSPALYASTNAGATWSTANNTLRAADIRALLIDPTTATATATTTVYAAGHSAANGNTGYLNFGLYRSDDGGATWNTLDGALPISNSYLGAVRALALDPNSCTSPPCTPSNGPLQRVYAVGHGRAPNDQNVADETHRVLRSDDRGTNWADLSVNPGFPRSNFRVNELLQRVTATVVAVDPVNPQRLYVGTEAEFYDLDFSDGILLDTTRESGLFRSIDGGANWTRVAGLPPKVNATVYPNASRDVVDLLIDPRDGNVLWLALRDLYSTGSSTILRSSDGGDTWSTFDNGIAASLELHDLAFDPQNPDILYAAAGGNGANPGAIYRGVWNPGTQSIQWLSISVGLPAESAYTVAVDPNNPNQLHAGTDTGVHSITRSPDQDGDGIPDDDEDMAPDVPGGIPGLGDGNGDGQMDSAQRDVGTSVIVIRSPTGGTAITSAIVSGTGPAPSACTQAVDVTAISATELAIDLDLATGQTLLHPYPACQFDIANCATVLVDITYHGQDFSAPGWRFRYFGPAEAGAQDSIGWHDLPGVQRVGPSTWRTALVAGAPGSYRPESDAIRFVGAPTCIDDRLFADSLESAPTVMLSCAQ